MTIIYLNQALPHPDVSGFKRLIFAVYPRVKRMEQFVPPTYWRDPLLFDLAPNKVYRASLRQLAERTGGLLHHLFTLPPNNQRHIGNGLFSVALSSRHRDFVLRSILLLVFGLSFPR